MSITSTGLSRDERQAGTEAEPAQPSGVPQYLVSREGTVGDDLRSDHRPAAGASRHDQGLWGHHNTRLLSAPDIPTLDEVGLPGFDISQWHGLWLPKGPPKSISSPD